MKLKLVGTALLGAAVLLAMIAGMLILRPDDGTANRTLEYLLFGILLVGLARVIQAEKHHRDMRRKVSQTSGVRPAEVEAAPEFLEVPRY